MAAASGVPAWKRVLVLGLIGVSSIALAYGIGRLQGLSDAREAMERAENLEARVAHLEARRSLDRSLRALDARNFGIAQEHLDAASTLLQSSTAEPVPELAALMEEVAGAQIVAAGDFGPQRQRLQGLIDRFDRIVPRPEADPASLPPR